MTAAANGDDLLALLGLLELLGFVPEEHVGICYLDGGQFKTAVLPPNAAQPYVDQLPATADIWFQANPTAGPVRTDSGRGKAEDVTRLAALWIDLDVKPGGCPTMQHAYAIVNFGRGRSSKHCRTTDYTDRWAVSVRVVTTRPWSRSSPCCNATCSTGDAGPPAPNYG